MPWLWLYFACCLVMIGLLSVRSDEIIISLSVDKELKPFFDQFKDEKTGYYILFAVFVFLSPIFLLALLFDKKN